MDKQILIHQKGTSIEELSFQINEDLDGMNKKDFQLEEFKFFTYQNGEFHVFLLYKKVEN